MPQHNHKQKNHPKTLDDLSEAVKGYDNLSALIATNPNTSEKTLEKMSNHFSRIVRNSVAMNPNTPIKSLEKLREDKEEIVKINAKRNLQKRMSK